jgi:hypothetical protein
MKVENGEIGRVMAPSKCCQKIVTRMGTGGVGVLRPMHEDAMLNALSRLSGHKSGHTSESAISTESRELLLTDTGYVG